MLTLKFFLIYVVIFIEAKPNFVLILTDDQDLLLDGLTPMKKTLKLVGAEGKIFENAFVNSPICCPSRSTILTGKYQHNTGVVNNSIAGNCFSETWQKNHEPFSIASHLKKDGYVTFYAGKYLNQYGSEACGGTEHVPQGYDWWFGLQGNSVYYNYTISVNGTGVFHETDYLTDLLADHGFDFLTARGTVGPFFMTIAPPAAHEPFTPAERHSSSFPDLKAVRNPSFNHTPTNKHWLVQMPPDHLPTNVSILDDVHRHRQQTLLAVDELVERIIKKLEVLKVLDNTYVIFTSDNGFHIGQFTQPWDKREPYETDIRIPLMVRGPGISSNITESYPFLAVDIAPTILELANITIPTDMDGTSLKDLLLSRDERKIKKHVFVEYRGEGSPPTVDRTCPWTYDDVNLAECTAEQWCKCQDSRNNTYTCVVDLSETNTFKFCQFQDFNEAYNLTEDPFELVNMYSKMEKETISSYIQLLDDFKSCSGKNCDI